MKTDDPKCAPLKPSREARAEEQERAVLEEERHAERADERRDPRRRSQWAVREPLDRDAEEARAEHGGDEHQRDQERNRHGWVRGASERDEHAVADERPDHVDVAVREVQELEDPVHHRVPESDERVDRAEGDPVQRDLEKELPAEQRESGDTGDDRRCCASEGFGHGRDCLAKCVRPTESAGRTPLHVW